MEAEIKRLIRHTSSALKQIYSDMNDAEDLPKVFHDVNNCIPLVRSTFAAFKGHIVRTKPDEETIQDATGPVRICKDKAVRLRKIFDEVISSSDPAKGEQYRKFAKGDRLEDLMQAVLKNVIQLAQKPIFADVTASKLDDLKKALSEVSPDDKSGDSFHNSGSGHMNVNTGTAPQNNNNGSGNQVNGPVQSLHLPGVQPSKECAHLQHHLD